MGKQLFDLKSGSHQGQGSDFQCSQCKNTPSEGGRSKQKKLHNFGPRTPQDVIFGSKWPFLSWEIGLSLENNAHWCVWWYSTPLPKSPKKIMPFRTFVPKTSNLPVLATYPPYQKNFSPKSCLLSLGGHTNWKKMISVRYSLVIDDFVIFRYTLRAFFFILSNLHLGPFSFYIIICKSGRQAGKF